VPAPAEVSLAEEVAAARRLAEEEEEGIWVRRQATTTADPRVQKVELPVGDATCTLSPTGSATSLLP
jgi:hypothetical protein